MTNDSNAPLSGITLSIAFPQGIKYVAGTISEISTSTSYGVTEANVSNLSSIDLNIGNLPKDSTVSMTFDAVAGFDAIAYQKWLALANFNGLEAWSEYRKSGFPVTPQSINYVGSASTRPTRLFYPGTELGSNGENVKAQGTIDVLATKIFWDVD